MIATNDPEPLSDGGSAARGQPAGRQSSDTRETTGRQARGQTEPLAALVAVAVVCLAVSIHAGFLTGLVPQLGSDRSLGGGTAERVWERISENAIYDGTGNLTDRIDAETLPQGRSVRITVTSVGGDGRLDTVDSKTFGPQATPVSFDPPDSAQRYERPVPIRFARGDIRPGTLRVVIWS